MSVSAVNLAAPIAIPTGPKVTLYTLAAHSCQFCGLTWLGNRRMQAETGLGESSLRHALKHLVNAGLVLVHAYPQGGRGRATEYIVLPDIPRGDTRLSPAPCGKCQFNQIKAAPRTGFEKDATHKGRATHGVSAKPRGLGGQNPVDGGAPTESNTTTITARASAREADPAASPPGPATPARSTPPTPAELRQARRMVSDIKLAITSAQWGDRGYSAKDGSHRPISEGNGAPTEPDSVTEVSSEGNPTPDG